MALLQDIAKRLKPAADPLVSEARTLDQTAQTIFQQKTALLETARQNRALLTQQKEAALNRPLTQQEYREFGMVTLEDYRQLSEAFAKTPEGMQLGWNSKMAADLSGQNITGFKIEEPKKMEQKERVTRDLYDQDGDGKISDFYTEVNFNGANLKDCFVDPATSFNAELAEAKKLEGITFNNMQEGDSFTFGSGTYNDIKLTDVKGGEINFREKSHVTDLSIQGKEAKIGIGAMASVSNLKVNDDFRIMKLTMGEHSHLKHSDLKNATISMASELKGATLENVQLGGNLADVDMTKVTLKNVTIDGKPILDPADLKTFGVKFNEGSVKIDNSKAFLEQAHKAKLQAQLSDVTKGMSWAKEPLGKQPAPTLAKAAIEAPKIEAGKLDNASGLQNATVGSDLSYSEFMNTDLAKAPKPAAKAPETAEMFANAKAFANATKHIELSEATKLSGPADVARKTQTQGVSLSRLPPRA